MTSPMTCPPDYDLGTVEGIVRTVEAMQRMEHECRVCVRAVELGPSPPNYAFWAGMYATEAAHHARRLQGVAELVEARTPKPEATDGVLDVRWQPGHWLVVRRAMPRPAVWEDDHCAECEGTGTSGERAADGAPLVCTACQGGRR